MTQSAGHTVPHMKRLLVFALFLCGCGASVSDVVQPDLTASTPLAKAEFCKAGSEDDRPFVIDWDATDSALFESLSQRDVVVVRYVGCELEVLDECQDEAVTGKYGAYEPTRWTSGSVEGFDMRSEAEVYAKLPLGAATLSGRVAAGKSLQLQYYVSGTRTATRRKLYEADFGGNPGCAGATHFVWGYNLGAFQLLTTELTEVEAEGGTFIAGAGGSNVNESNRLKKGGDIDDCASDSARDLQSCKVPIRLVLRKVKPGAPAVAAAPADGPAAVPKEATPMEEAHKMRIAAAGKSNLGDGLGCLAALDHADQLDPDPGRVKMQTMLRGFCEMSAGRCDDGKKRYRGFLLSSPAMSKLTAADVDRAVSQKASELCPVSQLGPADVVKRAGPAIHAAMEANDGASCLREAHPVQVGWVSRSVVPACLKARLQHRLWGPEHDMVQLPAGARAQAAQWVHEGGQARHPIKQQVRCGRVFEVVEDGRVCGVDVGSEVGVPGPPEVVAAEPDQPR
jgi:hypothetical protein